MSHINSPQGCCQAARPGHTTSIRGYDGAHPTVLGVRPARRRDPGRAVPPTHTPDEHPTPVGLRIRLGRRAMDLPDAARLLTANVTSASAVLYCPGDGRRWVSQRFPPAVRAVGGHAAGGPDRTATDDLPRWPGSPAAHERSTRSADDSTPACRLPYTSSSRTRTSPTPTAAVSTASRPGTSSR